MNSLIFFIKKLFPIIIGYIPVGISFALIAIEIGLNKIEVIIMSVFVLGAASQIAVLPLIKDEAALFYIFIVTFLINLRHVALSSSLAPNLKNFTTFETLIFSYGLTDESYTIHALDIESKHFKKNTAIGINVGTHIIWVISTVIGCFIGTLLINYFNYIRIDFALTAMFVSIVAIFIKINVYEKKKVSFYKVIRIGLIGIVSSICSIILYNYGFMGAATFLPAIMVGLYIIYFEKYLKIKI